MGKPVIDIELIGIEKLEKLFSNLTVQQTLGVLARGLNEEAQIIMKESLRRVPVDVGTLRRSATILPPKMNGSNIEIEMGYGGAASSYAMDQHENPNYRHKKGQSWKYLEGPVREYMPYLERALTDRIQSYFERKS